MDAVAGGLLIGLGVGGYFHQKGETMGCSGFFNSVATGKASNWYRTGAFFLAVFGAGVLFQKSYFASTFKSPFEDLGVITYIVAGFLVGFGTKLGNGCTSGHGLVGCARLSKRSFVATGIFVLSALLTVNLTSGSLGSVDSMSVETKSLKSVKSVSSNDDIMALFVAGTVSCLTAFVVSHATVKKQLGLILRNEIIDSIATFFFALTFALGLGIGGMVVQANIFSAFEFPSINLTLWILFMTGLAVTAAFVHLIPGGVDPVCTPKKNVTPHLVLGAICFGVGWGLGGFCPGPMLVQLPRVFFMDLSASGSSIIPFVLSAAAGVWTAVLGEGSIDWALNKLGLKSLTSKGSEGYEPLV